MEKKEENKQKAINKKIYRSPSLTTHGNIVSLTGGAKGKGAADKSKMKIPIT